jgi:hypothetical protein
MIDNCYAVGPVSGADACENLGSLLGGNLQGTVTQSYFLLRPGEAAPVNDFGSGLTDEQMTQQRSFAGWDFDSIWKVVEGRGYPRLRWEQTEDSAAETGEN